MRILHVTDWYLPRLGGIELHVSDLAHHQRRRGDDVVVLTSTGSPRAVFDDTDNAGVPVHRVNGLGRMTGVDLESFDLVHAHVSAVSPLASTVAVAATRAGVPAVVTVHSLWSGLGPLPTAAVVVFGLRRAQVTWTAVSEVAAGLVRRSLPGGTRVLVVPNAVDVVPRPSSAPSVAGGAVTIASVLRLARRKRPMALVRMFADARRATTTGIRLVLVGDGPQRAALERLVRRRGLADAVEITGRLDREGVRRALACADLYVAPASRESFGLAALEARSVGLPVIARAGSGVGAFVEQGLNGLLSPTDAAMTRDIVRLVGNAEQRTRISEHNRLTPSAMTWTQSMARHDEAYHAAALEAGGPALASHGHFGTANA